MATLAEPQLIDLRSYITAGRATFTLVSRKTGEYFTYKVTKREDSPHFVKLRQGPEYGFLGTIFKDGNYGYGRRSHIDRQAKGAVAFEWFWNKLDNPQAMDQIEFLPSDKCCACGRELTTKESVLRGIGPECAKRLGIFNA